MSFSKECLPKQCHCTAAGCIALEFPCWVELEELELFAVVPSFPMLVLVQKQLLEFQLLVQQQLRGTLVLPMRLP